VTIIIKVPNPKAFEARADIPKEARVNIVLIILYITLFIKGKVLEAYIFVFYKFLRVTILLSITILVTGVG